jgi:hypothetical protein
LAGDGLIVGECEAKAKIHYTSGFTAENTESTEKSRRQFQRQEANVALLSGLTFVFSVLSVVNCSATCGRRG